MTLEFGTGSDQPIRPVDPSRRVHLKHSATPAEFVLMGMPTPTSRHHQNKDVVHASKRTSLSLTTHSTRHPFYHGYATMIMEPGTPNTATCNNCWRKLPHGVSTTPTGKTQGPQLPTSHDIPRIVPIARCGRTTPYCRLKSMLHHPFGEMQELRTNSGLNLLPTYAEAFHRDRRLHRECICISHSPIVFFVITITLNF